jgi:hypothetical protein
METLKLALEAAVPKSMMGRLGFYSAFGLAGAAIFYYPASWLLWHNGSKYRKKCLEENKTPEQSLRPIIVLRKDSFRGYKNYRNSISMKKDSSLAKIDKKFLNIKYNLSIL